MNKKEKCLNLMFIFGFLAIISSSILMMYYFNMACDSELKIREQEEKIQELKSIIDELNYKE